VRPAGRRGPGPIRSPIVDHPHSEAGSITGGYVYRGSRLPELQGAYIYGDFQTGKVWALRHNAQNLVESRELAQTGLHLVSFGEDRAGELYLIDHTGWAPIYRLVPNPAAGASARDFPRTLSKTGLFTSTPDLVPAPGVVRIAINSEMWSDGARVEQRLLAIPGQGLITPEVHDHWAVPGGTVLARTVQFELEPGQAASRRRIETQILHLEDHTWRPYSYAWNGEQTDATLVEAGGSTRTLTVADTSEPGGRRSRTYRFHSRAECLRCHNSYALELGDGVFGQTAEPLAFNTAQMNRPPPAGAGFESRNQLELLQYLGRFYLAKMPNALPRLVDPYDDRVDLDRRARSYLHVNCAHCHVYGAGGSVTMNLAFATDLSQTRTVGIEPTFGTFGIKRAKIIAPGDPEGSVLYYRIAKLGGGRMPRLGADLVDPRGVRLIGDWIAQLPTEPTQPRDVETTTSPATLKETARSVSSRADHARRLLDTTRGALAAIRMIDHGDLAGSALSDVVGVAMDHPRSEIRELFERFIPMSERVRRLGNVVDQAGILNLSGDVQRGRQIFFAETTRCKDCHRTENGGGDVGPDLSKIGVKYTKPALLQHVLEPSQSVEPQYVAYHLETKSGQLFTGLLVARSDGEVVLKDVQGKLIRVPASEVDDLSPQSRSLMPDLLTRDLTAQQAADLLEYLASLK
jgi:putative heme-binding domain-containing protein